jgi:glycosyltransferase involved in cell wall biosynthesis
MRERSVVAERHGRLRILHAGSDICGVPAALARAQRQLGHDARAMRYAASPFGFDGDLNVAYDSTRSGADRMSVRLRTLARTAPRYDVFHLHAFDSLLPRLLDAPLLRAIGRTVVVHFHGCDIKQTAAATSPQEVHCSHCEVRADCSLADQTRRKRMAERFADHIVVSTPDLLAAVPTARWIPNPVDLGRWPPAVSSAPRNGAFTVAHIPSDPVLKGTRFVVAAVEELQRRGYPVRLRLATNVPHSDMPRMYRDADLYIDQLNFGWYGVAATEAMAMRRPVAAFLFPWVARDFGEPPVIRVDRSSLTDVLAWVMERPALLAVAADSGFEYVQRVHDPRHVAEQLIELYRARRG